jgi:hypothetical protein
VFGLPVMLLCAAQVAVIVEDVSVALVIVIQFCTVPIAIAGLAAGMEIVTTCFDLLTGLHIGTIRTVHVLVSARTAIRGGYAAKVAIFIDDLAPALLEVIQLRVVPIAVRSLAARFQIVSVALDVLAGLGVRSASHSCWISALVSRIAVGCADYALQVAVIVKYVSATLVEVIQLGFVPTAIAGLAARMKIVTTHMDILARLRIRAIGHVPGLISSWCSIAGRGAA